MLGWGREVRLGMLVAFETGLDLDRDGQAGSSFDEMAWKEGVL